jgi:hypothetical protein
MSEKLSSFLMQVPTRVSLHQMLAIYSDKVLLYQMSQMLIELLLQVELAILLIQLQDLLRDLFELSLNLSDLLGAILIQQHSLAVDQPGSFHILLYGFSIKEPDQMHIDELIVPSYALLRLHTDAIQHEIFRPTPLPM